MPSSLENAVSAHYALPGLLDMINNGLDAAGADPERPTVEALAPVDEFHTAGRKATLQALSMMPLREGMQVLDAGCGIGGTARCLARDHGCKVTGVDLTPEFVDVARKLTDRMGLSGVCRFETASVTRMPFADAAFDAAVTFHVAMNVADRAGFYDELKRVLKPGARLCVFDVMQGPVPGVEFPVPWAETAATSFLKTRDETAYHLARAGFEIEAERNMREFALDYFDAMLARMAEAGGPPPLGLHLLTGANTERKFANVIEAYRLHRAEPVIMVAKRI